MPTRAEIDAATKEAKTINCIKHLLFNEEVDNLVKVILTAAEDVRLRKKKPAAKAA